MSVSCCICGAAVVGFRRDRNTCSNSCAAEKSRRRARAWYAEHGQDEALKERVQRSSRRHYEKIRSDSEALAERRAATIRWRQENAEQMRVQQAAWRASNAERVAEKNRRRRARLLGVWVEDVDVAEIWLRDSGVCQLCGDPIDPALTWPNKWSRTLDHIVPLARGGTHESANVQLAHGVCNSRKSDRAA